MALADSWVKLGKVDVIPEGVTAYRKKRKRLAVFKEEGEIVRVFKDNCPHNERIMISSDYRINEDENEGKRIVCAFHGACFKVQTGEKIKGPGSEGLKFYEFEINESNELVVKIED